MVRTLIPGKRKIEPRKVNKGVVRRREFELQTHPRRHTRFRGPFRQGIDQSGRQREPERSCNQSVDSEGKGEERSDENQHGDIGRVGPRDARENTHVEHRSGHRELLTLEPHRLLHSKDFGTVKREETEVRSESRKRNELEPVAESPSSPARRPFTKSETRCTALTS